MSIVGKSTLSLTHLRGMNIAVLGLGNSGISVIHALTQIDTLVYVFDDTSEKVDAFINHPNIAGANHIPEDVKIDLLVVSPGINIGPVDTHPVVRKYKHLGVRVCCDLQLFLDELYFRNVRSTIIGITGTNGKSTVTEMISHVFSKNGQCVFTAGNIGKPVCSLPEPIDGAIYVIECSSFQLDAMDRCEFDIGILLNISIDHLDRHGSMEAYAEIKEKIVRFATKKSFIFCDDILTASIYKRLIDYKKSVEAISTKKGYEWFLDQDSKKIVGAEKYSSINIDLMQPCSLNGYHNLANIAVVMRVCCYLGLDMLNVNRAISSMKGLPHRLELVGEYQGADYFNDSKATNASAASMAIKSLLGSYEKVFWIAGGIAKHGGIDELKPYFTSLTKAYLYGKSKNNFASTIAEDLSVDVVDDLAQAVYHVNKDIKKLQVNDNFASICVLFSPACASFDQFKNFVVRGDTFKSLVLGLMDKNCED